MNCKICNSTTQKIFNAKILNKHMVEYFQCCQCGFVQTEEPHWLSEAYKNPINIYDTGILQRNMSYANRASVILYFLFNENGKYLDYSGGYGILTRIMRDIGFDFYWSDPYTPNLLAKGFEKTEKSYSLTTCFEVFEHLANPIADITRISETTDHILFSTFIIPNPPPKPEDWWYYSFNHGQHVCFYSIKSLELLAKHFNCHFYTNNIDFHLFSRKKINSSFFKILLKLNAFGLSTAVKLLKHSRTMDDHNLLKAKYPNP